MNKVLLFLFTYFFHSLAFAELIPSDKLFVSPAYNMGGLSPNGKYFSVKERREDKQFLTIIELSSLTPYIAGVFDKGEAIQNYTWLNDQQIYIQVRKSNRNVEYIYDFSFLDKNISENFNRIKNSKLVHWLPKEDNFVLVAKKGSRKSGKNQLYKILIDDLKNNNFKNAQVIDKTNRKITDYFYDDRLGRIITFEISEEGDKVVSKWRSINSKKWQLLFSYGKGDYQLSPVGFLNEQTLAVLSNRDTDKVALHEFDIGTQTLGKVLFQHPKYDLTNVEIGKNGIITSVHFYQNGVYTKQHFNPHDKLFAARLSKTFENTTPFIVDSSKNNAKYLIYTSASNNPGAYYLYDNITDKITRLYQSYPDLEPYSFAKTEYLTVTSADGTKLEAFLTKPSNNDHSTLLVMPHGGPIDVQETDYFNASIQYLANRGFTVLRVNFRGSSGFGKAFLEQGIGQFGQLIEQDISAAVSKVLAHQSYQNVCSIGSSYGGYSAVMLAMKHPEQYQCVIAAYGVYDLPLLFNTSNYRSGKDYHDYIAKVVGKLDESHVKVSPVYMAEKLNSPLLLIGGEDDNISGIEQSNRFGYLLKKEQKPLDTIFYKNTGHGHSTWWGERHEMLSVVDFLYKTLSLEAPNPKKLSKNDNEVLGAEYALLADSYDVAYKVPKAPEKSYQYYLKAAKYNHARSLFNVGSYYHRGELVDKDIDVAIEHYIKAAKLNYEGANARLGQIYMEGKLVPQDFDKAFTYLSKAHELDDSVLNRMRLGRFYCVANKKYKNMKKCFEYLELKITNKMAFNDFEIRKEEVGQAFLTGDYSANELSQLQNFIKTAFKVNRTTFDLDIHESGVFEYVPSDKYGKKGEQVLISEGNKVKLVKGKRINYGVYFYLDFDGLDTPKDKTILLADWTEINHDNHTKKVVESYFLSGNSVGKWRILRALSTDDLLKTYRLNIYNLNKQVVYTRDFTVEQ